jgi:hypothetical protein
VAEGRDAVLRRARPHREPPQSKYIDRYALAAWEAGSVVSLDGDRLAHTRSGAPRVRAEPPERLPARTDGEDSKSNE